MKPRTRPIAQLWYRWGRGLDLDSTHVANALQTAGLIEFRGQDDGGRPTHYAETEKMYEIPPYLFDEKIAEILNQYRKDNLE